MFYQAPLFEEKPQWIPIVVRDKNWLCGYIAGVRMIENVILDSLEANGVELDLNGIDLCLDSSRFNDLLETGKKESECTKDELKQYYQKIIEEKVDSINDDHPDNAEVFDNSYLEVECNCGYGIYTFKNESEVPEEPFICSICGRTVIDYTHHNDEEYEYDGDLAKRFAIINDETLNKHNEDNNDDEGDIL